MFGSMITAGISKTQAETDINQSSVVSTKAKR